MFGIKKRRELREAQALADGIARDYALALAAGAHRVRQADVDVYYVEQLDYRGNWRALKISGRVTWGWNPNDRDQGAYSSSPREYSSADAAIKVAKLMEETFREAAEKEYDRLRLHENTLTPPGYEPINNNSARSLMEMRSTAVETVWRQIKG